jgi:hypothetical protein
MAKPQLAATTDGPSEPAKPMNGAERAAVLLLALSENTGPDRRNLMTTNCG